MAFRLDEFIVNAYEPSLEDFKKLRRMQKRQQEIKEIYKPIATKMFVHADDVRYVNFIDLHLIMDLKLIEENLLSIWNIHRQIVRLFHNGERPDNEIKPYPKEKEIRDSVIKQLLC